MGEMTRYERKLYFERLMALRDAYRAETHEATDMTIELAISYGEQAFAAAESAEAAEASVAPSGSTQEGAQPAG
jgi:hypothetical protein